MSDCVINIENQPPKGVWGSFIEGNAALFKNFGAFMKICLPLLIIYVCLLAMFLPIVILTVWKGLFGIIAAWVTLIICLAFFVYFFWRFLLGSVAVSYLAKDILENKPVLNADTYYSYVEPYQKSFVKYWLWTVLFQVCFSIFIAFPFSAITGAGSILAAGTGSLDVTIAFSLIFAVIFSLISAFFTNGLTISLLFWAYGDKTNALKCVAKGVLSGFTNHFKMFIFYTLALIVPVILALAAAYTYTLNVVEDIAKELKAAQLIFVFVIFILSPFILYYLSFISTRYYFSIIKKK